MKDKIEFIAFDADDTLWDCQLSIQDFEAEFCKILKPYITDEEVLQELFKTEMKNLHMYGYGLKSIMLSMIETICRVTGNNETIRCVDEVICLGQKLLQKPVELLDGVEETLAKLQGKYKLILATKGDLMDQKRKITDSGLQSYFCHIEIMNDKNKSDYNKLLDSIGCNPQRFLMVGNSIKSDILPVLEIGAHAIHVPYQVTWQYEHHEGKIENVNFNVAENIREVLWHLL